MELIEDATLCRHGRYDPAFDADTGIRVGGRPGIGVPELAAMRFLCAARAPSRVDYVVNLFLGFDDFETMASNSRVLIRDGSLIRHAIGKSITSVESSGGGVWFEPQHYAVEPPVSDVVIEEGGLVTKRYSGTKLGGVAYSLHAADTDLFESLRLDRWRLFLQLAFPAETMLDGTWPFCDGFLWTFFRTGGEDVEWGYVWDF